MDVGSFGLMDERISKMKARNFLVMRSHVFKKYRIERHLCLGVLGWWVSVGILYVFMPRSPIPKERGYADLASLNATKFYFIFPLVNISSKRMGTWVIYAVLYHHSPEQLTLPIVMLNE